MGILDGPLAKSIYAGFKGKLQTGVIRQAAAPESGGLDAYGDPLDMLPVETPIEGFVETYDAAYAARASIPETDSKVCFFAQSAPEITPTIEDQIKMGTRWFQIRKAGTDPATALWSCQSFEIAAPEPLP